MHVGIARSDVVAFIEAKVDLPIMHRSRKSLLDTMEAMSMGKHVLEGIDENDALLFIGNYSGRSGPFLEALWVRAKWKKYRSAFIAKHKRANNEPPKSDLHADHIVNRKSLEALYEKHDPWVMIFEVPASANRGMGAKVERFLPRVGENQSQVHLGPLHAFKLFATDMPKSKGDFERVMAAIEGQILDTTYVQSIREAVACAISRMSSDKPRNGSKRPSSAANGRQRK